VDKKTYWIRTLSAESYRNVESMIYRVSGKQGIERPKTSKLPLVTGEVGAHKYGVA
jgi:hypothetical protein